MVLKDAEAISDRPSQDLLETDMWKNELQAIAVTVAALTLLAGGCGGGDRSDEHGDSAVGDDAGAGAAARLTVGVTLLTRTHPFYQDLEAGLTEAAGEAGFQLLVTAGEFDVAKQKDQIHDFIVKGVNAIVVSPCDSKSIGTAIQAANEAGIPVFTADIACLAEGVEIVAHVASDNEAGGRLAAQAMAQALDGAGEVAIIDHPEVESVIQRVKGFEHELVRWPSLEVVTKLSGRGVKDQAFRTAEDILQGYPELDGIFGINDDSALGALAAVEKAGRTDAVVIIGFDAVPEAREAIKAGKIYADVIQRPREIGKQTIAAVRTYIAGDKVEREILIPCSLFTREDALGSSGSTD
jgi:ribose transport system substrate-binding protein